MDFFINKGVKRSFVSLLGPISLYATFFGIGKLAGLVPNSLEFFNNQAILVLLGVGVIFSQIGIYITLRPIEKLFDRLLRIEPGNNYALRGNFAPIDNELQYEIELSMIKEGAIPKDINGVFLRNGPNPLILPDHNRHHWFDGDGHIHGFRIKNGKAFYCNR